MGRDCSVVIEMKSARPVSDEDLNAYIDGQLPHNRRRDIERLIATYTYASYWYADDPNLINVVPATDIGLLKDADGKAMDGTEVVVQYLRSLPDQTADPVLNRIRLLASPPAAKFGFPEVQPLRGASR